MRAEPALPLSTAILYRAQARFEQTPEQDRVLSPIEALRALALVEVAACGVSAAVLDFELMANLPTLSLFEPLSPALGLVRMLVDGLRFRMRGRLTASWAVYEAMLKRLAEGGNNVHTLDGAAQPRAPIAGRHVC